jgi:outer membrane receptor for ferrienterochelin and colicins
MGWLLWPGWLVSLASGSGVLELDPYAVVTTATRTERLAVELPVRTERLGPELFRSAGLTDLASALAYLPGARVEANCQNCGTTEIKLLGLGAGYNRLLFDGHPLFSGLAAVYGLEHIPTAFIERVEVVKGGASTLYGPGAVAGVINVIPHEPVEAGSRVELLAESFSGEPSWAAVGLVDWIGEDHKAAATLFGETRRSAAIDLNGDGFSDVTRRRFHTLGGNMWFYPGERMRLSANYAYTGETRRGGDRFDLPPHEAQVAEELTHRWHRGGLTLEREFSPDFFMTTSASISWMERDSYYGGVGETPLPGDPGFDGGVYEAALEGSRLLYGFTESLRRYGEVRFTRYLGTHGITVGWQGHRDDVFDEKRNDRGQSLRSDGSLATRQGEDPIADASFATHGLFIQDEWDPTPDWTVITGLRADRHSELDDWIASPRAAVRYTATEDLILRVSLSTGFRAPEIFDEDFHIEILDDPVRVRNNPGLEEETALSTSAGLIWTPGFASGRLQVDLEIYRTRLQDTFNVADIVLTDAEGDPFKLRVNAGGSVVQGFEANLLFRFSDSLSLETGLTFNDARFDDPVEVIEGIFEERFVETPRWSGVARLSYTNEEFLDVFLGVVYTGSMIAVNEVDGFLNRDTPGFFAVDLSFTRHIDLGSRPGAPHLDLRAGVRNLFDERQSDLTSGPGRDPGYFYGPRFPRSVFISASLDF